MSKDFLSNYLSRGKNSKYYYEARSQDAKYIHFGYIEASSDAEAFDRLASNKECVKFVQRVKDGIILLDID